MESNKQDSSTKPDLKELVKNKPQSVEEFNRLLNAIICSEELVLCNFRRNKELNRRESLYLFSKPPYMSLHFELTGDLVVVNDLDARPSLASSLQVSETDQRLFYDLGYKKNDLSAEFFPFIKEEDMVRLRAYLSQGSH